MVHLKCFRFCFVSFLCLCVSVDTVADDMIFNDYINIAKQNDLSFQITSTQHNIDVLNLNSHLYRYYPSINNRFSYLTNYDNESKSQINSFSLTSSIQQNLPLGFILSLSTENNLNQIKISNTDFRYRFSGSVDLSIPIYLASPTLLKHYTYYDVKSNDMYKTYYNTKQEINKRNLIYLIANYCGNYLYQKQMIDLQEKQVELDNLQKQTDLVLLEQGRLSISDFQTKETERYNRQVQLIEMKSQLYQIDYVVTGMGLNDELQDIDLAKWLLLLEKYISENELQNDYDYQLKKLELDMITHSSLQNQFALLPRVNVAFNIEPTTNGKNGKTLFDSVYDYWKTANNFTFSLGVGLNIPLSISDKTFSLDRLTKETIMFHSLNLRKITNDYQYERQMFEHELVVLRDRLALSKMNYEDFTNRINYSKKLLETGYMNKIDYDRLLIDYDMAKLATLKINLEYACKLLSR